MREREGTGRRGRRHKQLLDDHKEKEKYWNLKSRIHTQIALSGELALEEATDLS
jgi:hypothetical protein